MLAYPDTMNLTLQSQSESDTMRIAAILAYGTRLRIADMMNTFDLDILGEAGVRNDRMLEKLYRDVKILDIGEGTQQVQRVVVARQLVDFPRDA